VQADELFHADGQTDATNLIVAFHNFVKAPKKRPYVQFCCFIPDLMMFSSFIQFSLPGKGLSVERLYFASGSHIVVHQGTILTL
jgi:hypothetical protein